MMVLWLIQFFPWCLESILAWGTTLSAHPNLRVTRCAWAPYYPGIARNDLQSLIKTKRFCSSWQPGSCVWCRWPPCVRQKSKCAHSQEYRHGWGNPKEWVFRRMHFHNHVQYQLSNFHFLQHLLGSASLEPIVRWSRVCENNTWHTASVLWVRERSALDSLVRCKCALWHRALRWMWGKSEWGWF